MPHRAAIDIGSNSLLLTVVDGQGEVLHDEARVVGLGTGLGDRGLFAPDRLAAATEVLVDYLTIAASHGVPPHAVRAVATSAARRAMNAQTYFSRVLRDHELRVRIIPGEEEARLAWLGARQGLALPPGRVLVIDLGGGSTELVAGQEGVVTERVSLELGILRLTERYLPPGPDGVVPKRGWVDLQGSVAAEVSRHAPAADVVVGTAGTVTTLCAIQRGLSRYDGAQVHGETLTRDDLRRFIDRLLPANAAARRTLAAVSPGRADTLLAGCAILDAVLAATNHDAMIVSDRGLRFGLLA